MSVCGEIFKCDIGATVQDTDQKLQTCESEPGATIKEYILLEGSLTV